MKCRYICPNCKKGLTDEELERWSICPKCASSIREELIQNEYSEMKREAPASAANCLAALVKEHGPEIFDVSNIQTLYQALASWPDHLSEDRDRITLLLIKNIPHILYEAYKEGSYKQNQAVETCKSMLIQTFSVGNYAAQSMVGLINNALNLCR